MANKFSLSRGLKDVMVVPVTQDDELGYVADGTPEKLIPAGEITITTESEVAHTYFDDTVFASTGNEGSTTVSLTGAYLKPEMIAKITGKTVDETTGAIIDNGTFKEQYFAISARIGMLDGSEALVWFLKGTFNRPEETGKTEDDTTDSNGMTLEFTAIKTRFQFGGETGVKRVIINTDNTEMKASADWFKQVVTPENLDTVVQKKVVKPELTSVTIAPASPSDPKAGTAIPFTATADVTDGTTYKWEGTNGSFDGDTAQSANFTPTAQGECTVKVTATNGSKSVVDQISFTAGASE